MIISDQEYPSAFAAELIVKLSVNALATLMRRMLDALMGDRSATVASRCLAFLATDIEPPIQSCIRHRNCRREFSPRPAPMR
jgi:hypothetical protein